MNKKAKKDLVNLVIVFLIIAMLLPMLCLAGKSMVNKELLENTPLKNYTYWYSLDEFPKYKLEAAQMVKDLMAEGMEENEACLNAIDATSDKIYADTVKFCEQHKSDWDADNYNIDEELAKYMSMKQK